MTAALILVILWSAASGGAQINRWAGANPVDTLVIERRLFGLATGLVVLAYSILFVGLLGWLRIAPIAVCCLLPGVVGWNEHRLMVADIRASAFRVRLGPASVLVAILFLIFGLAGLIGCFVPPTGLEYDSLTYHLADPKIYLYHHRIAYLPWESHSNFAFTMEMLYTIGLSFHSIALAKLFHFTLAVVCALSTYLVGRRAHSLAVGIIGSLLFCSLPLVFWEAGTAYVDLGATAFGTLGLLAMLVFLREKHSDTAWLRTAGLMMACMVSVKATSLVPVVLFAAAVLIIHYLHHNDLRKAFALSLLFAIGAVALGAVWFIKSWIITQNPFYPFAYSIFGGRHWNDANAAAYSASQSVFGAGHKLIDLIFVPWRLVFYLLPTTFLPPGVTKPFNDSQSFLASLSPVFPAALFVPAFWRRSSTKEIRGLAIFGLVSLIVWFFLTQQVRYLIPVLPVYCLLTSFVIYEIWQTRSLSRYALSACFVVSLFLSCLFAALLIREQVPVALGLTNSSAYIQTGFPAYPAMEFLNTRTPKDAGVVFYGEPRDFYCDRSYMWGESGHGVVIPYEFMPTPLTLKNWLLARGIRYVYIDFNAAPVGPGPGMNGLVYGLTEGSGRTPVYQHGAVAIYDLLAPES